VEERKMNMNMNKKEKKRRVTDLPQMKAWSFFSQAVGRKAACRVPMNAFALKSDLTK
jgi:hypothetical protein